MHCKLSINTQWHKNRWKKPQTNMHEYLTIKLIENVWSFQCLKKYCGIKAKLLSLLKWPHFAEHCVFLAFTCSDPVFILIVACKYELPGIAQSKVIYHLLPARLLVTWSFCTYKILSELHSQEINDHDNRLPLMLQIMKPHKSGRSLLHVESRVHVRYFQLYEQPWMNSLFCSG